MTSVSFGLSWGMLGPSVGAFLYETFGGRPRKTEAFIRTDGTIATMRMAMDRHSVGTWSFLEIAAERREELLHDAHRVVVKAVEEARSGPVREVVLPTRGPGVDPSKVERIVERLTLQGIEVERLGEDVTAEAHDFYEMGRTSQRTFPEGSYVINMVQREWLHRRVPRATRWALTILLPCRCVTSANAVSSRRRAHLRRVPRSVRKAFYNCGLLPRLRLGVIRPSAGIDLDPLFAPQAS